jgi:PTH1 family peptidyl-tRNA hydrolase
VVVGLGNPGPEYENTRHNVGFWFVDYLAHKFEFNDFSRNSNCLVAEGSIDGREFLLVKPILFMNRSGVALSALWRRRPFELDNLLVCYDDADLAVGSLRIRPGGSAGGHNGLKSIIEALGTNECARLRFGIAGERMPSELTGYVLDEFEQHEEDAVLDRFDDAVDAVLTFFKDGIETAMSRFNSR